MGHKLICSYFKIEKKRTDDEKLYEIKVVEPCSYIAERIYNGMAVCEEHFMLRLEADKEIYKKSIEDIKEIHQFKMEKLREAIDKEYTKKKCPSWREAMLTVAMSYLHQYGAFWIEPCIKELVREAQERDNKK